MKFLLILLASIIVLVSHAQQVQNINASFAGGEVIIHYDLTGGSANQKYNVTVYSSHDAYATPLASVQGDVGSNLAGGVNKEIVWSAAEELGTFNGELSFKIRVEIIPLPFSFNNPLATSKVRNGKIIPISWEGGIKGQNIELQLLKDGQPVNAPIKTTNTGQYNWPVPKKISKGEDYAFVISDGEREGTTKKFTIKSKPPIWLILSPLVIGGAIIPTLPWDGGSPGSATPTGDEKLPAAPNPN
ncbi:MAG: Ser-Thr-rich GPI-anchored membrane family protein [Bacteroidota bacterium]